MEKETIPDTIPNNVQKAIVTPSHNEKRTFSVTKWFDANGRYIQVSLPVHLNTCSS